MYMPVPVYSEIYAVKNHSAEIASLGSHALIITGGNSARNCGALEDVVNILNTHKMNFTIFDRVEENPSVDTVMSASRMGKESGVDFVIGIGGGSPMDAAKAIAFMLRQPDLNADLLYSKGNDNALPLILIPTTCGTGSEVTSVSVLTVPQLKTKKSISHKIFADLALIDARYLKTASVAILRNTALDALTHMIESYINIRADDFSRMYVDAGLHLWKKNKFVLESGNASDEQLQEMMNASAMAGMAIAQTGTGIPHGLSYSLTYKLKIPHGKAVGYFTSGYLNAASAENREYLLSHAGFSNLDSFQDWYSELFGKTDVSPQILDDAIEELWNNQPKIHTAPFSVSKNSLKEIAYYSV